MSIPRFAIQRPVMMTMLSSIVILLGGISLSRLPVDLLPDITQPTVNVRVNSPGEAQLILGTAGAATSKEGQAKALAMKKSFDEGVALSQAGFSQPRREVVDRLQQIDAFACRHDFGIHEIDRRRRPYKNKR